MATPPPPHPADPQQVPPPAEPAAPAKKGGKGMKVLRVVVLIVAAVVVKLGISYFFNSPVHAEAGDCVQVTGSENDPKVSTKECGDKDANFKVVKVVENTFDVNVCGETGEAALAQQWDQEKFVLCLAPVK
ncbi:MULTISPECIES: hypothetical protein [unclassified Streptomyces]|uniref:LppU/SCO3897 family protein n=1 Tax=unclassified Streptomyces TaxID=2593676 RepID=UPI001BE88FD0|nr:MULTISPECIES: hypothetical protein [unclassified Streptomyces]MBT2404501.1 hypothetical protein [Streptomyces sp. ISL-21]MBT2456946.1 hypothetical protein [Streptomyces sp. ISL-86]MBT2608792.1 hypothetical protein [Streptomyces sp. ISL-87]